MRGYRQFTRLVILTVVAGLILVLTAYKAELNADRLSRFRQRDSKQQAAFELGQEVSQRLFLALKAGMTLDEVEEAFGPVTELKNVRDQQSADAATYALLHEKSQRAFDLEFRNGRVASVASNHSPSAIDTGIVLETPAYLASESVRTLALSVSLLAWCAALFAAIAAARFRRDASILLVGLSVMCGLCWFLAPNYSPTLRGISSNDNLAFFALLLICSLGLGATVSRQSAEDALTHEGLGGTMSRG